MMLHAHKGLAYLLFITALLNVILALSVSQKSPTLSSVLSWSHKICVLWLGRAIIVTGFMFWGMNLPAWWIVLSLLCWGPIEVMGKRIVTFELDGLRSPTEGSTFDKRRLILGFVGQLCCIAAIFGMMSGH